MHSIKNTDFFPEFRFSTARSGGSGGQHVNKVSSKVILEFDVEGSSLITPEQKARIRSRLRGRINSEGMLQVTVQEDRSQHRNKELAIKKFYALLEEALREKKKRVATKVSKAAKQKRLEKKKRRGEVKKLRRERF